MVELESDHAAYSQRLRKLLQHVRVRLRTFVHENTNERKPKRNVIPPAEVQHDLERNTGCNLARCACRVDHELDGLLERQNGAQMKLDDVTYLPCCRCTARKLCERGSQMLRSAQVYLIPVTESSSQPSACKSETSTHCRSESSTRRLPSQESKSPGTTEHLALPLAARLKTSTSCSACHAQIKAYKRLLEVFQEIVSWLVRVSSSTSGDRRRVRGP